MKVFVAGATGVVGTRVVDLLVAAGHQVTGLARSAEKADLLARQGARAARASLFDPDGLGRAVAGHDAVVNLATHIPVGAAAVRPLAWREDDRIRTEGSRVLVGAALQHEVGRLVQEAVTFVYPDRGDEWITEETIPEPNRRSQAATMAATAQAARFTAGGGSGVVLRFGQFYGPDRGSAEVLSRVRAGKPVVLGRPGGWLSPLRPEDAAAAVVAALGCAPGIYNVAEPPVRRSDWAAAIGAATIGAATIGAATIGAATAGATGVARFYAALLQKLAGPRAEPLARSQRVDSTKFAVAAGWVPAARSTQGGWSGYSVKTEA
jgi:nucleoside-diphosphate-sugar epimerase